MTRRKGGGPGPPWLMGGPRTFSPSPSLGEHVGREVEGEGEGEGEAEEEGRMERRREIYLYTTHNFAATSLSFAVDFKPTMIQSPWNLGI